MAPRHFPIAIFPLLSLLLPAAQLQTALPAFVGFASAASQSAANQTIEGVTKLYHHKEENTMSTGASSSSQPSNVSQQQHTRAALSVLLPPWTHSGSADYNKTALKAENKGGHRDGEQQMFAKFPIDRREIFGLTRLSFAFVNQKPVVPGHVLVSSKRVVEHFTDLTSDEVADLWFTAQRVGYVMKALHHAEGLTFAIQDGRAAGQTVPHTHIHVLPRRTGDFKRNDEVYEKIEATDVSRTEAAGSEERDGVGETTQKTNAGHAVPDDEDRKARTPEEMFAEASRIVDFIKNDIPE